MTVIPTSSADAAPVPARAKRPGAFGRALRNPSVIIGGAVVIIVALLALLAPFLDTVDPTAINPSAGNRDPGAQSTFRTDTGERIRVTHKLGTDSLGRDTYSRVLYGARVTLLIGLISALVSITIGLMIGLMAGYFRAADAIIMRVMDGLMAIPAILLAVSLVSIFKAGLLAVIVAITIPEVPRVVRLVRSVVLSVREEPYVEAARASGTPTVKLLWRHVLPNTIAPLIVQGTFICASAMLVESILSFLGVGMPADIPTWGNVMAEGRQVFRLQQHNILYPGIMLAVTVLAINMLGDGLRDTLDPKLAKRV
ncbi:MAG: hypothetical protein RL291_1047 [Pseudomonadota bacterium]